MARPDLLIGETVAGKYDVTELLGAGGFGAVYRAIQQPIGREVALKVIHPKRSGEPALPKRFLREARSISQLTGDGIVTMFDFGDDDGMLYMVLEYVRGRTLRAIIRAEAPLLLDRAIGLTTQVLDALSEAHAHGFVHRDLKPSNVMVTRDETGAERVKLLDFGLAKVFGDRPDSIGPATQAGLVVGTPEYISPEQATNGVIGPWTDLYSMGVVLYQMLSGVRPFAEETAYETLKAQVERPAPPFPEGHVVPDWLAAVVFRALEKKPPDRFQDTASMLAALRDRPIPRLDDLRRRLQALKEPSQDPRPRAPEVEDEDDEAARETGQTELVANEPRHFDAEPRPAESRLLWIVLLMGAAAVGAALAWMSSGP